VSEVATSQGRLRGRERDGVLCFFGIPFAAPPTGARRFAPPAAPEPWRGVRDAAEYGPAALQARSPIADLLGMAMPVTSEDCLTLNVWTPAADGRRRPVLFWIHGGAFVIGSGSQALYDGERLARRGDAVVVTINYRLGAFGFLRTREASGGALPASGNEGILDQIRALEWVQGEIARFGGDPGNVTVFGESAGSISVAALLVAPRAGGLFHRAILQSGAPNLVTTPGAATAICRRILDDAGIAPAEAPRLRDLRAEALLDSQNRATPRAGGVSYAPVADGDLLPADPFAAVRAGEVARVPILVGTNLHEMKLFRFMDPTLDSLDEAGLEARAAAALPRGGRDAARAIATYRRVLEARGESATPTNLWLAMQSDLAFRAGAARLAELWSAHAPAYSYLLTWETEALGGTLGACHALELPLVFGTLDDPGIGRLAAGGKDPESVSARMQEAWLAFARTGDPGTAGIPAWPCYDGARRQTMRIDQRFELLEAPLEELRSFWG
jgi:para-nitrobenzyl esterase